MTDFDTELEERTDWRHTSRCKSLKISLGRDRISYLVKLRKLLKLRIFFFFKRKKETSLVWDNSPDFGHGFGDLHTVQGG